MITLTRGEVALLELDNQPLNLVTVAMMEQLDEALDRARGRRARRARWSSPAPASARSAPART